MKKLAELVVVERKSDTQRIQKLFIVDTIETRGSALNSETICLIRKAQEKRGVIVFTDPDFSGEKIRKSISQQVAGIKHAFISQAEAQGPSNRSLGVEHAKDEAIIAALMRASCQVSIDRNSSSDINYAFLNKYQLINGSGAKLRRQLLGDYLHIGYSNGKQLIKRLNMLGISQAEVQAALEEMNKGGHHDQ